MFFLNLGSVLLTASGGIWGFCRDRTLETECGILEFSAAHKQNEGELSTDLELFPQRSVKWGKDARMCNGIPS